LDLKSNKISKELQGRVQDISSIGMDAYVDKLQREQQVHAKKFRHYQSHYEERVLEK